MPWNNRIIKVPIKKAYPEYEAIDGVEQKEVYGIFEVYYDENGKPNAHTEEPICGYFDSPEDIEGSIELIHKDLARFKGKILDCENFKKEKPCKDNRFSQRIRK